jgi:quercetin dioxygenase-like cupin family protein
VPFVNLANLEVKEPVPGYKAVFVHSDNMTVAYWEVEEGARILDRGSAVIIPPNTPHSGKAITQCRLIDVFHPVREDYQ